MLSYFSFLKILFTSVVLVLLDLHFYMRAFLIVAVSGDWRLPFSCGEQVSHHRGIFLFKIFIYF